MSRWTYVNGRYRPRGAAKVDVEDRGYQFSDGVYEVFEVRLGRLVDAERHLNRLDRSLAALAIAASMARPALLLIIGEIVAKNRVVDGMVYLQVTRGVARRDHAFPKPAVKPSLVVSARSLDPQKAQARAEAGVRVVTMPDLRWRRPDIKSISLLPNVLARQAARDQGADEAWFFDADGMITEGASCNAWIVSPSGAIVTRQADQGILKGVTRETLFDLLRADGLRLEERAFSLAEAHAATEAFLTGATTILAPVVAIDGRPVGDGRPGALTLRLRARFHEMAK